MFIMWMVLCICMLFYMWHTSYVFIPLHVCVLLNTYVLSVCLSLCCCVTYQPCHNCIWHCTYVLLAHVYGAPVCICTPMPVCVLCILVSVPLSMCKMLCVCATVCSYPTLILPRTP